MESKNGLFVGRNKGFIVSKPKVNTRKQKPSYRTRKCHPRVRAIKDIIREVAGVAPYERKMMELIKTGEGAKEKKAVKVARARLGTHRRALLKRAEIERLIKLQKKK